MTNQVCLWAVLVAVIAGCSGQTGADPAADGAPESSADLASGGGKPAGGPAATGDGAQTASPDELQPVPIQDRVVTLSPENTKIEFVGRKPDGSHTGGFGEFTGTLRVDEAAQTIEALAVEIQTDSIWTDNQRLTGHLKTPDFFNVREHPTAKFESTALDGAGDQLTITGNLTLHGVTKEIEIPATVHVTDSGLTLSAEFTIDRLAFGIDYQPDRIEKEVSMTVAIGAPTRPQTGQGGGGPGRGARRGDRGGRRFDPQAFFQQGDANGDGKLSDDEIPNRMRQNLDEIDTDGDGAVTLEEFQERMRRFRGRGRGGIGNRERPGA